MLPAQNDQTVLDRPTATVLCKGPVDPDDHRNYPRRGGGGLFDESTAEKSAQLHLLETLRGIGLRSSGAGAEGQERYHL